MSEQSEQAAFHEAMARDPEDTTTRLVYADWLDEHEQHEAAKRLRWWAGALAHPVSYAKSLSSEPTHSYTQKLPDWVRYLVSAHELRHRFENTARYESGYPKYHKMLRETLPEQELVGLGVIPPTTHTGRRSAVQALTLLKSNETDNANVYHRQRAVEYAKLNPPHADTPVKLARDAQSAERREQYTVQPGESLLGTDFVHEIHDAAGQRIGHVWVTPKDGGRTVHINHIGAAGHTPNATGLGGVRGIIRQLKVHYPQMERLTGRRVSGRRAGNDVVAPVKNSGSAGVETAPPTDETTEQAEIAARARAFVQPQRKMANVPPLPKIHRINDRDFLEDTGGRLTEIPAHRYAPPKRLARGKSRNEHDALLHTVEQSADRAEHTPMLVYADWLDEHDQPGGELLRISHEARSKHDQPAHPQLAYTGYTPNDREYRPVDVGPRLSVSLHAGDPNGPHEGHLRPVVQLTHWSDDGDASFTHYITIRDRAQLRRVLSALPPEARHEVRARFLALNREHPMKLNRQRLARKHSDLQRHADFWAHLNAVRDSHVKTAQSADVARDDLAHQSLADHITELTAEGDPRAEVVRDHAPLDRHQWSHAFGAHWLIGRLARTVPDPDIGNYWVDVPSPEAYRVNAHTSMSLHRAVPFRRTDTDPTTARPAVNWRIHIPRTRSATKKDRQVDFTKIFDSANHLHEFIDRLPKRNASEWRRAATTAGWEDTRAARPTRLTRDTYPLAPDTPPASETLWERAKRVREERARVAAPASPAVAPAAPRFGPTRPGATPPPGPAVAPAAPVELKPENHSMLAHLGLEGQTVQRSLVAWAAKHAGDAGKLDRFVAAHGYTDRVRAHRHLTALFIAAAKSPGLLRVTHPHTGQAITVRVRRPAGADAAAVGRQAKNVQAVPDPEGTMIKREGGVNIPHKFARVRADNTGSAQAMAGSTNHEARLAVVRETLKEAGLTPAVVRAALAHDGQKVAAAFAGVVKRPAHPDHLLYAAAWVGLLTGQKRLAVVHPDSRGEDFLHVISTPGTPDSISSALRNAGVQRFTTEQTGSGTRTFVLNPLGKYPLDRIVKAIPNAVHSSARVRVYRIGAGASSDADAGRESRRAYRGIIDGFERDAGVSTASVGHPAQPAGR